MQLDDNEEGLKGQHDLDVGPDSPTQTNASALHYFDMDFNQLCSTMFGGDPRLYESLKQALLHGLAEQDEEMAKLFDSSVLAQLIGGIGNKSVSLITLLLTPNSLQA